MIRPFPKPLFPKPRPQRLPVRKRVTIVIGMLNQDGLVMAADAEESTAHLKRKVQKLLPYKNKHQSSLVVGGAGPAYLVETITQNLWDDFADASLSNIRKTQNKIHKRIHAFYQKHVMSWPSREERDDYDFSLLLGVSAMSPAGRGTHYLWIAEKGVLRTAIPHAAIGLGENYAKVIMDDHFGTYPISGTVLVAIETIRKVKRDTPYCGKETQVWCIKNGNRFAIPHPDVVAAEELLEEYEILATGRFFATVISDGPVLDSQITKDSVVLREKFKELARGFGC